MIRRIVHPSDFSEASGAAFKKAVEMAKADRAELMVVHVVSPIDLSGDFVPSKLYEEIAALTRARVQTQLDKMLAKAKQAGVRAKGFVLKGAAHEEILRFAKSKHADLMVLGTRGRSGLAKLFLGSVAGRVVTGATCPVLTVKGNRP